MGYRRLTNKYAHTFWVSNGSVRVKERENSKLNTISHMTDLENFFLKMSSSRTNNLNLTSNYL